MFKNKSLQIYSIIGIVLSILSLSMFAIIITGMTLYLLEPILTYWITTVISLSIIFGIFFIINVTLYAIVILNKNNFVKNPENEFSFWISSFIFWLIPILSWVIFLVIYQKENKITND